MTDRSGRSVSWVGRQFWLGLVLLGMAARTWAGTDVWDRLTDVTFLRPVTEGRGVRPHAGAGDAPLPLVVPVQTRVISGDGSQATNFSVLLGDTLITAPPLPAGGNAGFHLVVLSRTNLEVLSNLSFGTDATSQATLAGMFQNSLGPEDLVILYTMGAPIPGGTGSWGLTQLPQFGAQETFYSAANGQFTSVYALIGNQGLNPGAGFELSSTANSLTTGQIQAVLAQDVNGNYFPVQPSFVTISTSTGPNSSSVQVSTSQGTVTIPAPAPPTGTQGGFHLVVLRRDALDQIATNPAVILQNVTFASNGTDIGATLEALQIMQAYLSILADSPNPELNLILLSSFGVPLFECTSATCNALQAIEYAFDLIAIRTNLVAATGGVVDFDQLQGPGYYSLLGIPWKNQNVAPKTIEVRSWTPAGAGATGLNVVLQRNPKGWFDPVASDTVGGVDYRMFSLAYQTSTPWPVAPNASTNPCPEGDEACAAYQALSLYVTQPSPNLASIREEYVNLSAELSTYMDRMSAATYGAVSNGLFSEVVFSAVQGQLTNELFYAISVQKVYTQYEGLLNDFAIDQNSDLVSALGNVSQQVPVPTTSNVGYDLEAVVKFLVQSAAAIETDGASKAALGVLNAVLGFGLAKNRSPAGNTENALLVEASELSSQIQGLFNNGLLGMGILFKELLSDWGKLQTVGSLAQEPPGPGNGFSWGPQTEGRINASMVPGFTLSFYQSLMNTIYQRVVFASVPFSDPSQYCYQDDCTTSHYGTFCKCHNGVYSAPAYDYLTVPEGTDYNIYVIATSDIRYPAGTVITNDLVSLRVYLPDFLQGVGTWTGILTNAQPQGWSDYLNPIGGWCSGDLVPAPQPDGTLQWVARGELGRRYQLERAFSLGGEWLPQEEPWVAGPDFVTYPPPLVEAPQQYFRLRRLD
ncbi:MAG: hypothetical protein J0M24_20275 [Verrucomicrobia bacterium]|nr:hypothetical protein [Verrucomicrobiota bacterium]